jgi:hypothetical protein
VVITLAAGRKVFLRVQAEAGHVAESSGLLTLVGRPVSLSGVLDYKEAVLPGYGVNLVHVGHQAMEVGHQNGPGPRADLLLDLGRVQIERDRVDVDEHRYGHLVQGRQSAGHEAEGGHDNLVARTDAQRGQSQGQSGRAVAHGEAILGPDEPGPLLLQTSHLRLTLGRRDELAASQNP